MLNRAPLSTEALNTNRYAGVAGVLRFTPALGGTVNIAGVIHHITRVTYAATVLINGALRRFTAYTIIADVVIAGVTQRLTFHLDSGSIATVTSLVVRVNRTIHGAIRPLGALDHFITGQLRRIRGKLLSQYTITGIR